MKKIGQGIEATFRGFMAVSDVVQVICLGGIIILYAIMITLRFFGINFRMMEETVLLLAVWSYAIGAYQGTYNEEHIAAGLIQNLFKSARARAIHKIILDTVSLAVCAILTVWIWKWVQWSLPLRARSTVLGYPLYWKYFSTLCMYGFSVVFFVRSWIKDIKQIINPNEGSEGGKA